MIANTTGVDMVIAGHDHSTGYSNQTFENRDGDDVLVVNAGGTTLTKSVFTATLQGDNSISITLSDSENVNLNGYAKDQTLKALIAPYADAAAAFVNQPVGTLTGTWDTVGNFYLQQSDTIDLINRAQIAEGSRHLALKYPEGAARDALYSAKGLDHLTVDISSTSVVVDGTYKAAAGPFSMRNIYQLYKYDNTLYLLPVTGQQIKDILENNAQNHLSVSVSGGEAHYSTIGDDFANPVFYGLNFTYDMAKDPGERVTITEFANGNSFDLNKMYIIAINNYHLGNTAGPFAGLTGASAIWSQTDDMSGATVQNLIADFVASQTEGVSPVKSQWSLTYSGSLEDDLADTAYIAYASATAPADGDTVIFRHNASGKAVSATASANKLSPSDVIVNGSVLYADNTAAAFTAHIDDTTGYYTFTYGGKYLTSGPTGNSLSLTDSADANGCSNWEVTATTGGWLIRNIGAAYNNNHNQNLEYYSNLFTTYGYTSGSSNPAPYVFSFYKVIPTATLMTTAPADGDQFVFWYNAGNKIISSTAVSGKLNGVVSAVAGEQLPVYEGSAVFTAHLDSTTGYYTFTCDGKYLTSGSTGNSLSLTASPNDYSLWTVETTTGGWLVPNVNAKYGSTVQYLEYYQTGFTTYGLQSNLAPYIYNFYKFNGYAPDAPQNNQDQAAPTDLTGVAPTTASNNDGRITGTTTAMEYKLSSSSTWTACIGTSITGLFPGTYEVRLAAKTGYNASPSTTVTVPAFGSSSYAIKDLTLQPGSDESEMNFSWYSNSPLTTAEVQVAPKSAMTGSDFPASSAQTFTGTTVASGNFKSSAVSVTDLAANTEYVYRVGDGTDYSGVYSFKTHDATTYSIIFVGDPQIGSSGNDANDAQGWRNTVTSALEHNPNASFILSAGDQVENAASENEYDGFFSPLELTSIPLAPAIGNHDSSSSLYSYHYNSPNESTEYGVTEAGGDYWFTYGNTLYMVLNVNNMSAAEHRTFMEAAISANEDAKWRIVTMHHSVYTVASHAEDEDILQRREALVPIFKQLDIDVVLQGHDHVYTRSYMMDEFTPVTDPAEYDSAEMNSVTDTDDILYVTANSASGSKYYDIRSTQYPYAAVKNQEHVPNFSEIHVSDTEFTITTYRSSDKSVVDTFTINRTQAEYSLAIGSESAGGAGYRRDITINGAGDPDGKYLVVQFTYGSGSSAKVSVVMIELTADSIKPSISYQNSGTKIEVWLTSGMPDLTAENMGVTIYANARTN